MRRNTKIAMLGTLAGAALLIWVAASRNTVAAPRAESQSNCNVANVAGTYAYVAFGTVFAGNPAGFPPGAYSSVATLKHDGAGNYTVDAKTSYNGVIVSEHFEGTYEVGDDCQVTYFVEDVPAVQANFANNRSEGRAMWLVPGTSISGSSVRK